ncbi:MAG: hypothetical protein ACRYG7_27865 [Janthinobacterium lividum]
MTPATSPTVFFENTAGQVLADPAGYLYLRWGDQPRTLAETQAILQSVSKGLQQYGWSKMLGSQLDMPPFSAEEQAWIAHEWLPHAVQVAGYRSGAILLATNLYARLATAFVTTSVQGLPMRYRSFDSEAEAIAWLLMQP